MISISNTFKKCLFVTCLMLSAVGFASAQSSGTYTFPLTYGTLSGSVFSSYTTFTSTCGNRDLYTYTQTTYTLTGWSITGSPIQGGGALSGQITYITSPEQAECPTSGWQNPGGAFNFFLKSPGFFSSCTNQQTGWEGGYVTLETFPPPEAKFFMTLPASCPS